MPKKSSTSADEPRLAPPTTSRPELLVDGYDRDFRTLVSHLFALAARHENVRAGHAALIELSPPQYTVLVSCAHMQEGGPVRIKQLAEHLCVTPTFVTIEVKNLVNKGLMSKTSNARDSRVVDLAVTDAGFDLLESLAPLQRQVNDQQFADITTAEFRELLRLTDLLISNSDRALALQAYLASGAERPSA